MCPNVPWKYMTQGQKARANGSNGRSSGGYRKKGYGGYRKKKRMTSRRTGSMGAKYRTRTWRNPNNYYGRRNKTYRRAY